MTQRLERRTDDGIVAGICAGLGAHLNVDPVLIRLVFVALAVVGGAGLLLYALCWVIIPEAARRAAGEPAVAPHVSHAGPRPALGLILIAVGGLLLVEKFLPFAAADLLRFWPVLLVVAGIWILLRPNHGKGAP